MQDRRRGWWRGPRIEAVLFAVVVLGLVVLALLGADDHGVRPFHAR